MADGTKPFSEPICHLHDTPYALTVFVCYITYSYQYPGLVIAMQGSPDLYTDCKIPPKCVGYGGGYMFDKLF